MCDLCKVIESVSHLFIECVVARNIWDIVDKVFGVLINVFESLATKWLGNTRYMHLNIVFSAILWSIWNNKNGIVFNRWSWINIKKVWCLAHSYLKLLIIPLNELEKGKVLQFMEVLLARI